MVLVMMVEERVKKIVANIFETEYVRITRDTRFLEDLFAKSINIIQMVAMIEDEFDIEIDDVEARKNKTVGQTIDYVERLLNQK